MKPISSTIRDFVAFVIFVDGVAKVRARFRAKEPPRRSTQPRFANARSIRNAIGRARLRQAARLFESTTTPTREQLTTIEAQDILRSSVFGDDPDLETDPELTDPDLVQDT